MFPFRCLNLYYNIRAMKKAPSWRLWIVIYTSLPPAGANVLPGLIMAGVLEVFLVVLSRPKNFLLFIDRTYYPRRWGVRERNCEKSSGILCRFCVFGSCKSGHRIPRLYLYFTLIMATCQQITNCHRNHKLRVRFVMHLGRFFALMIIPRCFHSEIMLRRAGQYRSRLGRH